MLVYIFRGYTWNQVSKRKSCDIVEKMMIPPPDSQGFRIVDRNGTLFDWEVILTKYPYINQDFLAFMQTGRKVDMFAFNRAARDILVRATAKLGVSASYMIGTVRYVANNCNKLEDLLAKNKKVPQKLLAIDPVYADEINPLPVLASYFNVHYTLVPDAVESLVNRYDAIARKAQEMNGESPHNLLPLNMVPVDLVPASSQPQPDVGEGAPLLFCPFCGKAVKTKDSKFCSGCGQLLP